MPDDDALPTAKTAAVSDEPAPAVAGAAFPIVGLGASAGGLEALQQLLGAVPVDTGIAFVVVQHLAPGQASSLAEILSHATKMPVAEVGDEPAVEPDHVYVIPPGRDMIVAGGKLVLLPQQRHAAHRGIDRFFRSLAEDSAHLAIGVVLSGGLSDGTVGLEEIKAAGGVTFAQDDSAQHESMPRSAVASGCVDFVLPPEKIAEEIARIARHSYIAFKAEAEDDQPAGHGNIAEIVRGATGVDFTHYKASTLRRRITRRMMLHRLETPAEYEEHLRNSPEEIEELYQDILISVTSFFRDPDAFEALTRDVFPKLIAACPAGESVRLWIVGCSSGEEAYSLAMVFTECAEAAGSTARLQVFATDVNPRCVEKARAGLYSRSIVQEVSPERLSRFFTEENGGYRVRKAIRERCVFSRHNLLSDPAFSRVDFIACRNLLIYLDPAPQQKIMPIFHYALKADGWLWLGSSESVGATSTLFEAADLRHKIFTRRGGNRPASTRVRTAAHTSTHEAAGSRQPSHGALHRDAERMLLAKYAPPGVVVSAGLEIVQFQGDTSPFLAPASGAASHHLLKMLREGLAGGVRDAVQRAQKENGPARAEGLRVRHNGDLRALTVEVIPIKPGAASKDGGFVVLFDETQKPIAEPEREPWLGRWWKKLPSGAGAATLRHKEEIRHLTQELAAMRESLLAMSEQHEAVVEELRSANEEAQSANEEMQSVNEELETSKEEMEASNEELATLNDELGERNVELNRVNEEVRAARDYAERILENVPSPLLVLNAGLRVRTVSRAFYETFHVAPAETVGRFIYELGNRQWDIPALRQLLEEMLPRGGELRDFEVRHTFPALGARVMRLNARRLTQNMGDEPLLILSIEDFTERSEAAEALRHSEERFRMLANAMSQLAWIARADGHIFWYNQRWYDYTGTTPEAMEGWGWQSVHDPAELPEVLDRWKAAIASGEDFDMTFPLRGADGIFRLFLTRGTPLKNAAGEVIQWFGTNTDVDELKRAEEALRASEERYRSLFESIDEAFCVIEMIFDGEQPVDYRFIETSPSFEKQTGLAGVRGKTMRELLPAHEALWFAIYGKVAATGEAVRFQEHAAALGRWYDVFAYGIGAPGQRQVAVLFNDITERRGAEDALRASEEFQRSIIASSPDCIKVLDLDGRLLSLEAGHALLGITDATPLLGTSWIDFWVRAADRAGARAAVTAAGAGGEGKFTGFFRTAHGLEKWWSVVVTPIRDASGQTTRLLAVSRDVTEQREMETVLVARAEELARADRSKDEFLAMLAHELRNPLAPLRNAAELLNIHGATHEERSQAQRIIGRQIENMSRMLDDLLDVSRITEGKIELRKKTVSLEGILTAATSMVRSTCAAHQQDLSVSLPDEPVYLNADATRLEQVFGNLLSNACKYSGHGCHIALRATLGDGEVAVSVSDDGAGIDPELLPRIFGLFVQASRSLDREHGGLGIGLTLVERLVKLHGGSIEAHSEGLGKGAEFIVNLPIIAEAPPPAPLPPPPAVRETPLRILIVDDNRDSARSLATLQKRRGHEMRTAFTGPEAVAAAAEFLPEVVLLDIGLPGMDGFEVARQIRAMPALRNAFLVAMSGYGRDEDRAEAKRAGFDEYMVKPVDLDTLREWLRNRGSPT